MKESEFQKKFLDDVRDIFPDALILKNDSSYKQGIPDWSVIVGQKAALLEIKIEKDAHKQPNQKYYINERNNKGGFGRFVYPENKNEVMVEMIEYFNNK